MNHLNQINHSSDKLMASNFDGVFQYGSNFIDEQMCYRDGIAPQVQVNGLPDGRNVFIPMTDEYLPIRNFLDAHSIDNYGWIFTEPLREGQGKVIKRNQ